MIVGPRRWFIGAHVEGELKQVIIAQAHREKISVSRLISEILDRYFFETRTSQGPRPYKTWKNHRGKK